MRSHDYMLSSNPANTEETPKNLESQQLCNIFDDRQDLVVQMFQSADYWSAQPPHHDMNLWDNFTRHLSTDCTLRGGRRTNCAVGRFHQTFKLLVEDIVPFCTFLAHRPRTFAMS